MMELQPVGTKRLREDAGEEDKSRKHEDQDDSPTKKGKHEDQDDSPTKKLVDHQSTRSAQSVSWESMLMCVIDLSGDWSQREGSQSLQQPAGSWPGCAK